VDGAPEGSSNDTSDEQGLSGDQLDSEQANSTKGGRNNNEFHG